RARPRGRLDAHVRDPPFTTRSRLDDLITERIGAGRIHTDERSPLRKSFVAAVGAAFALAVPPANADVTPVFDVQGVSTWTAAQTLRGGEVFTPAVVEGGWSAFAPIDNITYWTVSDRGPNGLPAVNGPTRRTFLAPAFTPTIYKVQIGAGGA